MKTKVQNQPQGSCGSSGCSGERLTLPYGQPIWHSKPHEYAQTRGANLPKILANKALKQHYI